MKRAFCYIFKFILISFLTGFFYHLVLLFIHTFAQLFGNPQFEHSLFEHISSVTVTLILLLICIKFCKAGSKTCDDKHHNINKIRE